MASVLVRTVQLGQTTPSGIVELWKAVEPDVREALYLEDAAQALTNAIYGRFEESVVMARLFVTVPFDVLPPMARKSAQRLAKTADATDGLRTVTPVLSLVGTRGVEEQWNDRRRSKGHAGVPLISSAFVGTIPMISHLLKELGIPLEWVDSNLSEKIMRMGRTVGPFFVDDAGWTSDELGRKIITAQDFVGAYRVKSVFGIGGAYVTGQIMVLVVFCRDQIPRTVAEDFLLLVALFRASTEKLVGESRIFKGP